MRKSIRSSLMRVFVELRSLRAGRPRSEPPSTVRPVPLELPDMQEAIFSSATAPDITAIPLVRGNASM